MANLTLLEQMKMVAGQFLGMIPAGSYYDFNGQLCIITGIDAKTGNILAQAVNGGQVTINPIAALYPNAVAAPVAAAPAAAAGSSIGSTLSAISGPATAGLPFLLGKVNKGKNIVEATKQGAPGAAGANWDAFAKATSTSSNTAANSAKLMAQQSDNLVGQIQTMQQQLDALKNLDKATNAWNASQANQDFLRSHGIDPANLSNDALNDALNKLETQHTPVDVIRQINEAVDKQMKLQTDLIDAKHGMDSANGTNAEQSLADRISQGQTQLQQMQDQLGLTQSQLSASGDFSTSAHTAADNIFNGSDGQLISNDTSITSFNPVQQNLFNQATQRLAGDGILSVDGP